MTQLLFRTAVLLPVLCLIAIVVMGQFHVTAKETLRAAARRAGRWIVWIGLLVLGMELIAVFFIGW
ncbi:hypothetical protein LBMAG49_31760 [Planctomycetota bacterium]|jgi:hypothetical protein|nr:hypothetical protein [Planctomycetota bacterium]MSR37835.1 hypothetical protein [Planctomycetota bacterium]GDY03847.1 hypothetical protein LBMAG49_31760 [Planctomycetota bacterium]